MSEEKKQQNADGTAQENETPETVTEEATDAAVDTASAETADVPTDEAAEETTYTVTAEQMQKMESLAKLVSDTNDKYLRLAAEYDNYRKRTTKEKETVYNDAKADTIKPFLDVYDNLVRGAAQLEDGDSHKQGLEMIAKQFLAVLEKLGVTEIDAEGQPFDPDKHNAVMHVEDENAGENTVVEVFQKGFAMGDKVLRFSMVKVAN